MSSRKHQQYSGISQGIGQMAGTFILLIIVLVIVGALVGCTTPGQDLWKIPGL